MSAPLLNPGLASLIQLDSVALVVPQLDLHAVESMLNIIPGRDGSPAGHINLHGQEWPVYCLTDNLDPVDKMTGNHRICAMLISGDNLYGLVCQEVTSIDAAQLRTFKLPACMRTPGTPLRGVGILGARIVCLTSAQSLHTLLAVSPTSTDTGQVSTAYSSHRGESLTDSTEASA